MFYEKKATRFSGYQDVHYHYGSVLLRDRTGL